MFIICICLLITYSNGHTNKVKSEADLQSALMPQELNPAFVPEKFSLMPGDQWQGVLPVRTRRDTEIASVASPTPIGEHVKHYGRLVAFVVLILSAISEIVLYFIGVYYNI